MLFCCSCFDEPVPVRLAVKTSQLRLSFTDLREGAAVTFSGMYYFT